VNTPFAPSIDYSVLSQAELSQYFARIGFTGIASANLATLQHLHYLHPLAIPFENIDSFLGQCPSLQAISVFNKLVTQRRGGYCFEHNQLLLRVLSRIGFQVRGLSARVILPDQIPPRTHMVLIVTLDDTEYLVDVGFGGLTMTTPLNLQLTTPQLSSHEAWRLEGHPDGQLLSAQVQGAWLPSYIFCMQAQTPSDYVMANWYVATHPESRFVNELIAARPDAGSRHALLNRRYMQHRPGQESIETQVTTPAKLMTLLEQVFLINVHSLPNLEQQLAARLFSD
jgi:N-hydroxyarylamine O-acetyltransferase